MVCCAVLCGAVLCWGSARLLTDKDAGGQPGTELTAGDVVVTQVSGATPVRFRSVELHCIQAGERLPLPCVYTM